MASPSAATPVTPSTQERTGEANGTPGEGPSLEALDPESEAIISDLANTLRPTTQAKIVTQVSQTLDVSAYVLGDVMAAKGVNMEEAREIVHSATAPIKAQADLSVKAEGVPDDAEF